MTGPAAAPPFGGARFDRVLGRVRGGPGPTLVVLGGLHGNEPAGALAAQRVLAALDELRPTLRGELVAVAGNLGALARGRRYLSLDLNRCWLEPRLRRLREESETTDAFEEAEQRELVEILDRARARAGGPLIVLDLHTTSGEGPPFSIMSDTLRNRRFAFALPIPVVLGLEETLDGTLLDYMTEEGHIAICVEGGQHDDPASVDHLEAAIWMFLERAGCVRAPEVPLLRDMRARLERARGELPRVLEIRHRQPVLPGDRFRMRPGYRGFQRIVAGEVLAEIAGRPVRASENARLLMPLYQEQGDDGFFLVRAVDRGWLRLSTVLRRLRLQWILPLLPGVRRHPEQPRALLVDPRVARLYVREIFHLFGFRRRRPEADLLVFSRRRER